MLQNIENFNDLKSALISRRYDPTDVTPETAKELLDSIEEYEMILEDIASLQCREVAQEIIDELADLLDVFQDYAVAPIIETRRKDLQQKLVSYKECNNAIKKRIKTLEIKHPVECKKCTSKMTIREKNGDYFWGCPNFPSCWSSKQLNKHESNWIYKGVPIPIEPSDGTNKPTGNKPKPEPVEWSNFDQELFEALREWRRNIAHEEKVPAYIIIQDKPLRAVAHIRPSDKGQLAQIPGFGSTRIEKYGDKIIDLVSKTPPSIEEEEVPLSPEEIKKQARDDLANGKPGFYYIGMGLTGGCIQDGSIDDHLQFAIMILLDFPTTKSFGYTCTDRDEYSGNLEHDRMLVCKLPRN
jgi:ssDNA-binding Zn-finger/Zn-ribbon topoisomerase 1